VLIQTAKTTFFSLSSAKKTAVPFSYPFYFAAEAGERGFPSLYCDIGFLAATAASWSSSRSSSDFAATRLCPRMKSS
jgi:hypothetical protein